MPYNATSRDRRKSVVIGELTLQPNSNKSFLKQRFSLGQSLAKVKSVIWLGLPLTVSRFREYSDKKNTNKNLKTLAVIFTCNTEYSTTLPSCKKVAKFPFVLFLKQLYPAHVVEFL